MTQDEYDKKYPKDAEYRAILSAEASQFYRNRMMELIDNDYSRISELKGYVPGLLLPGHLMYRIDTLRSRDGHRLYEFLIEYDTDTPSEGIYYGCRGITIDGFDHDTELEQFRNDWQTLMGEVCTILNNTFPNKDFSHRFKVTDNANTNTYWLFWITLHEDEDIKDVGVFATQKIRDVFKYYLNGGEIPLRPIPTKKQKEQLAFVEQNYDELLATVQDRPVFEKIMVRLEELGWIEKAIFYDKAWIFKGIDQHRQNVDFIALILGIKKIVQTKRKTIPWSLLERVFLNSSGEACQNLREQSVSLKGDTIDLWASQISGSLGDLLSVDESKTT